MDNYANLFDQARSYHQAGSLLQAEYLFRQIVQGDPAHADAWFFLGVICHAQGRLSEAEEHCRRSIEVLPSHPSAHNCLGIILAAQGKLDQAVASFEAALCILPGDAEILGNLGLALLRQGKAQDAIATFRQALQGSEGSALIYYNFALALKAGGKTDEAIAQFHEALRLQPDFVDAMNDLGNVLADQERLADAVSTYRQALRLRPDYSEAHYNLAIVLERQNRTDEAIGHYQQAILYKPDYVDAYLNLGNAWVEKCQLDQASECYEKVLHIQPDHLDAYNGVAFTLIRKGFVDEALARFKHRLQQEPDSAIAQSNYLLCLNYDCQADPDVVYAEHCRLGQSRVGATPFAAHANDPIRDRRLLIGYVSPDFRQHALMRYLEPVLSHHDSQQVNVFCYADVAKPDAVTARLRGLVPHWRSIKEMTDAQAADQIRADHIDILVDLAGLTGNNRLGIFALKPAPVQVTWLGYLNTTGLPTMDYRLTDAVLDPPGQPRRDAEELFRLPSGFCCFAPPQRAPDVAALPALRRGFLTFGSVHNLFKLNDKVYDLWTRVLQSLPTARLLMLRDTLIGTALENVRRQFAQRGISPDRLEFRRATNESDYLRVYEEMDVCLDAFPWSGGVTTCESLWMGVPVLSLAGARPASRNTAAILARVGLNDWAFETSEACVNKAARLPTELTQLAELRAQLRDRMTQTICNGKHFTRELETAYRAMWQRWCEKKLEPS